DHLTSIDCTRCNLTRHSNMATELEPNRFDLLSELVPKARVIGLLVNPNSPTADRTIGDIRQAAHAKGVELHVLKAPTEADFESAFASLGQLNAGALVVAADPYFNSRREELVRLAARYRVPAIYEW